MRRWGMRALVLAGLVACSFQPGSVPASDSAAHDGAPGDARKLDGAVDACAMSMCVADGGTCQSGTCVFVITDGSNVLCPAGVPCDVKCTAANACSGTIDCTMATTCTIDCNATGTCTGHFKCTEPNSCTLYCRGQSSCNAPCTIDDSPTHVCDIECCNPSSCMGPPPGFPVAAPAVCTGTKTCP